MMDRYQRLVLHLYYTIYYISKLLAVGSWGYCSLLKKADINQNESAPGGRTGKGSSNQAYSSTCLQNACFTVTFKILNLLRLGPLFN